MSKNLVFNSTHFNSIFRLRINSTFNLNSFHQRVEYNVCSIIIKKVYIFENNDDDDDSDDDKSTFHDSDDDESIFQQHFITFIKTLFVVHKLDITNQSIDTFIIQFTFDVHQFTFDAYFIIASNDAVSINFSYFVSVTTLDDINDDVVVVSIINNDAISIDLNYLDINSDVVSINFDHFAISFTLSLFENVIEKLSISFSKIVYIVFNNESNNKDACDTDNVIVKKKFC